MDEKVQSNGGWNPYLAGALAGILAIASAGLTGKFLGASTSFVRSAAIIEKAVAPEYVEKNPYFAKIKPKMDWQMMMVVGILVGSFLSAITSKSFKLQAVPDIWAQRFGKSTVKRAIAAFIGGAVAIFGARLADGCPSGHGLSGLMPLSISGFIALVMFFVAGVVMAAAIYGKGGNK